MRPESEPEGAQPESGIFLARPDPLPTEDVPLAVKDLFDTAGLTTTYGSVVFADHIPERSAEAVVRLEAAEYANTGKTNLHEFAYGVTSQNPHYGTVPNPAAPGRTAGGSSGGSAAALAAGLAEAALGTDSGGSIRIPAACCGIVGFKPTFGLVPLDGVFPLAPTFDHAGPMARTVGACEELMEALVPGFAPTDQDDFAVGVAWLEHSDSLVATRMREAAEALSPRVIDFPLLEGVGPMFMREVAEVHQDLYAEHSDLYGANVGGKIERCLAVTDSEYETAVRRRMEYREQAEAALAGLDLLLVPTLGFVPPPADVNELEVREAMIRFTLPFNALGWPALALPVGPADDGLPASIQVVGRAGDDALVLAAGGALEAALAAL
ncbi:MAG TPA: amidase [Gaiellaceae bacterium]|nr:amidase [Gaiellaceae bacterium]